MLPTDREKGVVRCFHLTEMTVKVKILGYII